MKICHDQGCNDIGAVIANDMMPLHIILVAYISHLELFFQNCLREVFPPIVALMFVKLKWNL